MVTTQMKPITTPAQEPLDPVLTAARMTRAMRRLRDLHPDMTLLQAMFFLSVAANPGASQRDIYALLDTNDSNAARTIAILSDIGGRRSAPLDLIKVSIDPLDRRQRMLDLTPKGRRLMDDIAADIEGSKRRK
jgi:DNA-binding MarR family transcriptional regulator